MNSKPFDWKGYAQGVADYIDEAFKAFGVRVRGQDGRITAMEARLNALESRAKDFSYLGVWRDDTEYVRNNFTTHGGSLWACRVERTRQRPADGSDWQLAVRKGRDA